MAPGSEETQEKKIGVGQGEMKEPWFRKLSSPILFLLVSLALVGSFPGIPDSRLCISEHGFSAHRHRRGQRRHADRPDAGDNHEADRRSRQQRARPDESEIHHQPRIGRSGSVLRLELRHDPDAAARGRRGGAPAARPSHGAKIETHRLTFATFPILGYSLTSDTVPQSKLWEIATYDLKPRINRLDGVASVLVQGGRVPEFQVTPDPARLLAAGITVTDILEAIRRTNLIDSPGLLEHDHQLVLGTGERASAHAGTDRADRGEDFERQACRFALETSPKSRHRTRRFTRL